MSFIEKSVVPTFDYLNVCVIFFHHLVVAYQKWTARKQTYFRGSQ